MFLTEFDEAAWEKTIREEEHEEGKKEGREEKRTEDILIFITDKREDGISDDKIREKLKKFYELEDGEIDAFLQ